MALGPDAGRAVDSQAPGANAFRAARPDAAGISSIAAGIVFAVLGVSLGLWSFQYDAVPNLPVSIWALLLPLTLLGLVVQTGAEEVLFRGYMQSQLAARFRSPIAWLRDPKPAVRDRALRSHAAGDNAWLVVGVGRDVRSSAADLTARTGSIGAAWGFHFANNTVAIAILSTGGTITGLVAMGHALHAGRARWAAHRGARGGRGDADPCLVARQARRGALIAFRASPAYLRPDPREPEGQGA
jgi:hypothetical protein